MHDPPAQAITDHCRNPHGEADGSLVIVSHNGSVEVEAELFDHGGEFARAFAEHAGELLGCLWFHGAAALFEALEGEVETCLWFVKFGDVFEDGVQAGEAVVNQYLISDPQVTGFAMADQALAGHGAQAVIMMRSAISQGTEPIALIGALAMKLRSMAKASAVRAGTITQAESNMAPCQVWGCLRGRRAGG